MAVTIDDIAVELGRATPAEGSIEAKQWGSWIGRAEGAIHRRAERFGVDPASLDRDAFDEVVTYIVARLARTPLDGAEQVTESAGVDDDHLRIGTAKGLGDTRDTQQGTGLEHRVGRCHDHHVGGADRVEHPGRRSRPVHPRHDDPARQSERSRP